MKIALDECGGHRTPLGLLSPAPPVLRSTKLLWAGSRYLVKGLVKLFSPSSVLSPMSAWEEPVRSGHAACESRGLRSGGCAVA